MNEVKNEKERSRKPEQVFHTYLEEEDVNAILIMMNAICEKDEIEKKYSNGSISKYAKSVIDAILKYRKPYSRPDGKGYKISLYESQVATLIRTLAMLIRIIMTPDSSEPIEK